METLGGWNSIPPRRRQAGDYALGHRLFFVSKHSHLGATICVFRLSLRPGTTTIPWLAPFAAVWHPLKGQGGDIRDPTTRHCAASK